VVLDYLVLTYYLHSGQCSAHSKVIMILSNLLLVVLLSLYHVYFPPNIGTSKISIFFIYSLNILIYLLMLPTKLTPFLSLSFLIALKSSKMHHCVQVYCIFSCTISSHIVSLRFISQEE